MELQYTIILHPDKTGGYWAEVPALPGCGSQGETLEEAVEMTKDAIAGYLELLKRDGKPVPEDLNVIVKVTVAA